MRRPRQSKIFPNEAFGYWKVIVERPLRLTVDLSPDQCQRFRAVCRDVEEEPLANVIDRVATVLGAGPHRDFNRFMKAVDADASERGVRLTAKRKNLLRTALASRDEAAEPVIKKVHKLGAVSDSIRGLVEATVDGRRRVVEYEPDSELRDTEQVPLLDEGGIEGFLAPRGVALCARCLVRSGERQDWLRDQLHALLLQAAANADVRRRFGRIFWRWKGRS